MLLNSHISAYARCLAGKVCSLVRSTWGTSQGEDKLGARNRTLNTKVARQTNIPPLPRPWHRTLRQPLRTFFVEGRCDQKASSPSGCLAWPRSVGGGVANSPLCCWNRGRPRYSWEDIHTYHRKSSHPPGHQPFGYWGGGGGLPSHPAFWGGVVLTGGGVLNQEMGGAKWLTWCQRGRGFAMRWEGAGGELP